MNRRENACGGTRLGSLRHTCALRRSLVTLEQAFLRIISYARWFTQTARRSRIRANKCREINGVLMQKHEVYNERNSFAKINVCNHGDVFKFLIHKIRKWLGFISSANAKVVLDYHVQEI
jgi:hypothetical protein